MQQDTHNPAPEEALPDDAHAQPRHVKTLLTVVIVLGILLLVGLAVVVGTIIKRVNDPSPAKIKRPGFGEVMMQVPENAELLGTQTTADRLVLRLRDPQGDFLMVLDIRKGIELGRIRLTN